MVGWWCKFNVCVLLCIENSTAFVVTNKLWNKKQIVGDRSNCSEVIDDTTHVLKIDWLLHGDDASEVLKTYVSSKYFQYSNYGIERRS